MQLLNEPNVLRIEFLHSWNHSRDWVDLLPQEYYYITNDWLAIWKALLVTLKLLDSHACSCSQTSLILSRCQNEISGHG